MAQVRTSQFFDLTRCDLEAMCLHTKRKQRRVSKKAPKQGAQVTLHKVKAKHDIKIATLNLQGGGIRSEGMDGGKTDEILKLMKDENLDVLFLQETRGR